MAVVMRKLYIALRRAGVDEQEASEAAEEVANYDKQLGDIRTDLAVVKAISALSAAGVLALVIKAFLS